MIKTRTCQVCGKGAYETDIENGCPHGSTVMVSPMVHCGHCFSIVPADFDLNKVKADAIYDILDSLITYKIKFEDQEIYFYKQSDLELHANRLSNGNRRENTNRYSYGDSSTRLLMSKAIKEAVKQTNKGDDFGRFSCLVDDLLSYADKLEEGNL